MKHKDSVLVTVTYHPKPGHEEQFVQVWNEEVATIAHKMGATTIGIYHNEDTEDYLASTHWPTKEKAQAFLDSKELEEANEKTNKFCLVPASREVFEILREAA